jgi:hypothetical protein
MFSASQVAVALYFLAAVIAVFSINNLLVKPGCLIVITGDRVHISGCQESDAFWKAVGSIKPHQHLGKQCNNLI